MTGLFDSMRQDADMPLSETWRPKTIDHVFGQDAILSPDAAIGVMIASRRLRSMILWGPPGSGKTTIAGILPDTLGMRSRNLSGGTLSAADLRSALTEADMHRSAGLRTVLVVEEIHRMTRALQDQLLRPIESGQIVLIGCTTEHVAYEIVDALLSRLVVLRTRRLETQDLEAILADVEERSGRRIPITGTARRSMIEAAGGDARRLLGFADAVLDRHAADGGRDVDVDDLESAIGTRTWRSDKDRDLHYDRMSAMQKAVRASDPDAALFWLSQMIEAGEDMDFVMRRMLILANEEVGLADPQALIHCVSACEAHARLGQKAGLPLLAQAVLHLACSPKSNSASRAYHRARTAARNAGDVDPNPISVNHPTAEIARTRGYVDDHAVRDAFAGQDHWPSGIRRPVLYRPSERGAEAAIGRRLERWSSMRAGLKNPSPA